MQEFYSDDKHNKSPKFVTPSTEHALVYRLFWCSSGHRYSLCTFTVQLKCRKMSFWTNGIGV